MTRRPRGTFLLRHVPEQLIEYPLETLIAAWGILSGLSALAFDNVPASIQALYPDWVGVAWGVILVTGGLATTAGLARKWYASVVPRGMQLIAAAATSYAVTILINLGMAGSPAAALLFVVGLLCALRAWFLQVREEIFTEIARASA